MCFISLVMTYSKGFLGERIGMSSAKKIKTFYSLVFKENLPLVIWKGHNFKHFSLIQHFPKSTFDRAGVRLSYVVITTQNPKWPSPVVVDSYFDWRNLKLKSLRDLGVQMKH